uniref:7TM_GPCR_Srx domain-containing protein n=1 Tax=Caenorhabditis tropicalis TaxID=1561998 RepID=A0A1I7SYB2_9PELO
MSILPANYTLDTDDRLAGVLVSAECFLGAFLISLVIFGCFKIPSMRTPFGNLTMNQSTSQIIACLSNGIFFFLALVIDFRPIVDYSFINGAISLCLLGIIILSYFLMSLNRLTAITLPFQYSWLFGYQDSI